MKAENTTRIQFDSLSVNEAYARGAAAAFLARYDPTVPQLAALKTAVSEAVTNCIVHAYRDSPLPPEKRMVELRGEYYGDGRLVMTIKDCGRGISDIKQAMEPLFTTDPEGERSGMGFTVMESFTDRVRVRSKPGKGTVVRLEKNISIT